MGVNIGAGFNVEGVCEGGILGAKDGVTGCSVIWLTGLASLSTVLFVVSSSIETGAAVTMNTFGILVGVTSFGTTDGTGVSVVFSGNLSS